VWRVARPLPCSGSIHQNPGKGAGSPSKSVAFGTEIARPAVPVGYAERERLVGAAATEAQANAIAAQPIDNFNIGVSTLTLDGIVERLHANLQCTA
jgi:hypothetical protein